VIGYGGGNANITVADYVPSTDQEGALWWDTISGNLYIRYQSTWVQAMASLTGPKGDSGTPGLSAYQIAMPELVNAAEDGTKSLNYNGIIGVLVETIKELRLEVKTLSDKVDNLETKSKSKKGSN
jgi:hypothetical protein